jgi:5-oxoprolinase (ATP-hydrolysing) subunit C
VRFDQEIDVTPLLGSRATNSTVGLGGFKGRALAAGDRLTLLSISADVQLGSADPQPPDDGPIRIIWGIHADLFRPPVRDAFLAEPFRISPRLDRMGVRLDDPAGVFAGSEILSLVSDAIVPGDIQILGDGTPIVLMRDHQPTGGYPRIATVVSADLDRFAQLRPGTTVSFAAVSLTHAAALRAGSGKVGDLPPRT